MMFEQLDKRIGLAAEAHIRAVMAGNGWAVDGWAVTYWRQVFMTLVRRRQSEVRLGAY